MARATVNIVEHCEGMLLQLKSFEDTPWGNECAEKLFEKIATENGMTESDKEACLEDGFYENGDYRLYIIHSQLELEDETLKSIALRREIFNDRHGD